MTTKNPWVVVVGGALAYDVILMARGHDALSTVFRRAAREHPVALTLGVGYLLGHLYGFLPGRSDAFRGLVVLGEAVGERLGELNDVELPTSD